MGRIVMINGIFNGNDETEKVLEEGGFTRMEREMMELDLRNFPESDPVVPEGYSIEGLAGLNIDDYLRVESDAYKGTHDEILFSTKEDERLLLNRAIFEGGYGDIITNVSRIAKHNGEIAGACIVTNRNSEQQVYGYPLIIDVFVAAGHRKKGLARAILHDTARRAKVYGLSRLFLWVNLENEARTLYENTGFSESDYPHEIIYYLMP